MTNRKIKFSILLQHEETGYVIEKIYDYCDIFNGKAKKETEELNRYYVFAKREFTGLKDKNGKEIYEGDIVKTIATSEYKSSILTVIFLKGRYLLSDKNRKRALAGILEFDLEVIGNIYENKELLEENK